MVSADRRLENITRSANDEEFVGRFREKEAVPVPYRYSVKDFRMIYEEQPRLPLTSCYVSLFCETD